jgi:tetratricopeptide (TPR) repeat protein
MRLTEFIATGLQGINPYLVADVFVATCLLFIGFTLYMHDTQSAHRFNTYFNGWALLSVLLSIVIGLSSLSSHDSETNILLLLSGFKVSVIIGILYMLSTFVVKLINNKKSAKEGSGGNNGSVAPVTPRIIYSVLKKISDHNAKQEMMLTDIVTYTNNYQQNIKELLESQQSVSYKKMDLLRDIKQYLLEGNHLLAAQEKKIAMLEVLVQAVENNVQQNNLEQSSEPLTLQSAEAYQQLAVHVHSIPQIMQQFIQLTQDLHQQFEETKHYLESFQHLRQQAGEALPMIEKNLNEITQGMRKQIQHNLEMVEMSLESQLDMTSSALESQGSALETQLKGFSTLQSSFVELENQMRHSTQQFQENIDSLLKHFTDHIQLALSKDSKNKLTLPSTTQFIKNEQDDWSGQGYAAMDAGDYKTAITCFEQAIQTHPNEFSLYYNKACCHALSNQIEPALVALQHAISLNADCINMAKNDADFKDIHAHPDFQSLLK